METLAKFITGCCLVIGLGTAQAQQTPKDAMASSAAIQAAFSSSYNNEMQSDFNAAIQQIKSVYDDKSYEMNARLGWLYYLNSDFKTSITYYQKAITLRPDAIEARFGFCIPAASLDRWDDVLTQYAAILKIDSHNTLALYRTGMIYFSRKEYAKAQSYFVQVTALYPFDYDSANMLAWSLLMQDKKGEARTAFQRVLIIRPGDSSATEGLGKAGN